MYRIWLTSFIIVYFLMVDGKLSSENNIYKEVEVLIDSLFRDWYNRNIMRNEYPLPNLGSTELPPRF